MATVLGWNLVTMPSFPPAPASIEWQPHDTVAVSTNPFTGQQQTYDWQAGWLEASLSYQPMNNAQAVQWCAFLMGLNGTANVFQWGDPLNTGPQNPNAVAPSVHGGNQTGYVLSTFGGNGLLPGDWIQIGYRLHRITSVSGGSLGIWPQLRESPADGSPIVITNTQGLWRLKSNDRKWSVKSTKMYGFTFEIREAL